MTSHEKLGVCGRLYEKVHFGVPDPFQKLNDELYYESCATLKNLKNESCDVRAVLPLRRNGSTCVDLILRLRIVRSNFYTLFYLARKSSQNKENRMAIIISTHHVQLRSLQTICIKFRRRRPARYPSFARTASAAETVLIKQQIRSLATAVPFSHKRRQRWPTAGTACRRTARRLGPAVAASVASSSIP